MKFLVWYSVIKKLRKLNYMAKCGQVVTICLFGLGEYNHMFPPACLTTGKTYIVMTFVVNMV